MKYVPFLVLFLFLCLSCQQAAQDEAITVGGILFLSGPAGFVGETFREGMELAREDLAAEGIVVNTIYEDSRFDPKVGVQAYRKLTDIDNVDVIISLGSRVSVPLLSLIEQDQQPTVLSYVLSQNGAAKQSDYLFRFFGNETSPITPQLEKTLLPGSYERVALISLNDEYGQSVADITREALVERNIPIVVDEKFLPQEADYQTILTKVKENDADAVIFVGVMELVKFLPQMEAMGVEAQVIEPTITLTWPNIRAMLGPLAEGAYASSFPAGFTLLGEAFAQKYEATYGEAPYPSAYLGYDVMMFIGRNVEAGMNSEEIVAALQNAGHFSALNGDLHVSPEGEINPVMTAVQVVNGTLVPLP